MCVGTKTTFACGHVIWHFTTTCAGAATQKDSCSNRVINGRFINDTCADCDPGVRRKMLQARYDQQRAVLVQQYMNAAAAGDTPLMFRLNTQMMRDVWEMRTAMFEIGLERGDPDQGGIGRGT